MNKLKAVTSVLALVVLICCSNGDETNQATMNVQAAKSAAKEIPYKSEIERGLTLQFDYMNIPQGIIDPHGYYAKGELASPVKSPLLLNGQVLTQDSDNYMKFLFSAQRDGLITMVKFTDNNQERYNVKWTPKALTLRDGKNSDVHRLRIPLGACHVQTVVKDIEYHNPNLSQTDDFRLVMGTYEDKPTDFGKSQAGEFGVFKFRVVIKLNPFNQTYSYVTGDWGKIDADGWLSQNITQ